MVEEKEMVQDSRGQASVVPEKVEGAQHGEGEEEPFFPRVLALGV